MLKGISPLVAIVLLIAFAVAVAGLISTWLFGFSRRQTELVSEQARIEIICSYGRIYLSNVKYCSTNSRIYGKIENLGGISLGKIEVDVIFNNGSIQSNPLCIADSNVFKCEQANLTLKIGEAIVFNFTTSSNYEWVRVITNCSAVFDEVSADEILQAC